MEFTSERGNEAVRQIGLEYLLDNVVRQISVEYLWELIYGSRLGCQPIIGLAFTAYGSNLVGSRRVMARLQRRVCRVTDDCISKQSERGKRWTPEHICIFYRN